jgi:hypothetical protein
MHTLETVHLKGALANIRFVYDGQKVRTADVFKRWKATRFLGSEELNFDLPRT